MLNDKEKTINQVAGKDKSDGDQHVDEITGIVSWGNFGHGATSVKKSLRNHFGRINNV